MNLTVKIKDQITPDLRRKYAALSNKQPLHEAIALGLVSLAKRSFTDGSLRPSAWAPKKDGTPATLRLTGTLAKSVRGIATARAATIVSDRHYAAIHQLGGTTAAHTIRPLNGQALRTPYGLFKKVNHPGSKIPARPYMPFYPSGRPTAPALLMIRRVLERKVTGRRA